jgi:hypothetical protein
MKKHYLFPVATLLLSIAILSQSNSGGPAASGSRATGAPGDGSTTCVTCHSGGSFGAVNIDLEIRDDSGNVVAEYVPGGLYNLTVQVNAAGNPSGYGFQMIALRDNGNITTNSFQSPGNSVRLSTTTGRQYAEHNQANASGEFSVAWKAPAAGSGDVTFYVGANAVNGNGINSGDNAALFDLTIVELGGDTADTNGNINGRTEFASKAGLNVYPNPVFDVLNVVSHSSNDEPYKLYNSNGRLISVYPHLEQRIDLEMLPSGIYFLVQGNQQVRFLKH